MIHKIRHIAIGAISLLYLTLSIGIDVSMHYCLGELKDVNFFSQTIDDCCSDWDCAIERSFDCCDNKFINYQIEEDQRISERSFKYPSLYEWADLHTYADWLKQPKVKINTIFDLDNNAIPLPTYLLNCSFIYYG